jgi:hypothetical protein
MAIGVSSTFAQDYVQKKHIKTNLFGTEEVSAIQYDVLLLDKSEFQKLWKKEMAQFTEGEVEFTEFQVTTPNFKNDKVSTQHYTSLLNLKTTEQGLEMVFAFKDSTGFVDFSSDPHKEDFENYFEGFIKGAYLNKLNEKLKNEQRNLDQIDSDIKGKFKAIAKNEKNRIRLETEIDNTKKQIEINRSQYDVLLGTIQESKTELATTSKDSENYKVVKKEVKNLEKNKKNMESDYLKSQERIYDNEAAIKETDLAIENLNDEIASLEEKKAEQKEIILEIEREIYQLNQVK